jgi:hypothetical protein
MPWTPKSTSPESFNLADAFLALVTGDATWGWLVDWLPYITNDHFDTAEFCAFGPITPPDLAPILGPSPPDRNPLAFAGKLVVVAAAVGLAARDRVFSAYCESPAVAAGWSDYACYPLSHWGQGGEFKFMAPAGATGARMRVDALDEGSVQVYIDSGATLETPGAPAPYQYFTPWPSVGDHGVREIALAAGQRRVIGGVDGPQPTDHATVCFSWNLPAAAAEPYVPMDGAQPAGVLSPLRTVAPTLDDMAHELEFLELKLDDLGLLVRQIAGATLDLAGAVGDPVDLVESTPLAVGDAVGCVVTASGVPSSRSLDFGEPQNIVRLAHVNMGTATAWYPSIWMTHSPFIIRPFPLGVTRVTVTALPPGVTCSIALISRLK